MMLRTKPRGAYVDPDVAKKAAREWAGAVNGWYGRAGGWVYSGRGTAVVQGWWNVYRLYWREIADYYVARLTAFATLQEMLDTPPSYRPTLLLFGPRDWRYRYIADCYDVQQQKRGDPRRAFRGTRMTLAVKGRKEVRLSSQEEPMTAQVPPNACPLRDRGVFLLKGQKGTVVASDLAQFGATGWMVSTRKAYDALVEAPSSIVNRQYGDVLCSWVDGEQPFGPDDIGGDTGETVEDEEESE